MNTTLARDSGLLVSVIVPVYNAMPYVKELLDSLANQDLSRDSYEVILVNDGSTDGSGLVIDEYCAEFGNFQAIHQPNSGWPGGPRNRGLERCRGKYVFFADSDDVLDSRALSAMASYAEENASDVVIPRLAGIDGRSVSQSLYKDTRADLDLPSAFRTLGPIKLYRKELLDKLSIRFPEGMVRLEDGIFNADVYLAANRISVLSGLDYYLVRARSDGNNISTRSFVPEGYTNSVAEICRKVQESSISDDLKKDIILGTYRRKCLKFYHGGRFNKYTPARRQEWLAAHRAFIEEFISEEMEASLPAPFRTYSALVRRGLEDDLLALGQRSRIPALRAKVVSARWQPRGLDVSFAVRFDQERGPAQMVCELRGRRGEGSSCFPIKRSDRESGELGDDWLVYEGVLSFGSIGDMLPAVYDVHALHLTKDSVTADRASIGAEVELPAAVLGTHIYRTKYGNASVHKL